MHVRSWIVVSALLIVVALFGLVNFATNSVRTDFSYAEDKPGYGAENFDRDLYYDGGRPDDLTGIAQAYRTAFDFSASEQAWLAAADAPVELGHELKTFSPACGDPDIHLVNISVAYETAFLEFYFANSPVGNADSFFFYGRAERIGDTWMVTQESIQGSIDVAGPVCGP